MQDQIIMNTALTFSKNMCEILVHGTIESATPKVNKQFDDALDKYLEIQNKIYNEMSNLGFYKIENVPETKITKVKDKHGSDKIC